MPQSNDTKLSNLLKDASTGQMQLPDFQRNWTWDDERVRGILASLSENYPMGAIMVLQYGNPQIKLKFRPLEGVNNVDAVVPERLILDGQQRMTSIYLAAFNRMPVKTTNSQRVPIERYYFFDMKKCLDPTVDRVDSILSVPADKKVRINFGRETILDLSTREKEYEHRMFPVNIVFDGNACVDWLLGFITYNASNPLEAQKFYSAFNNSIIKVIDEYQVPVITLDKNTPKEAVCQVFENVNTGGVPLTVFELVTAAYAMNNFNLREDWEKCKRIIRNKEGTLNTDLFDGIDQTAFLTTVTLYSSFKSKMETGKGFIGCKKKDVLNLPFVSYMANRNQVLKGFEIAKNFLVSYQYVFRRRDLPYTTQIIPLAAICAYLGQSKCNEPTTIDILSRWYWNGILGEMYGGANETRYANDIEDVVNEVEGKPSANRTVNGASFSSIRLLSMQSRLSAAYKGIMALLYKQKCKDFVNDITIDLVSSMANSPDIHHIFPQKYCIDHNLPREKWNSIVNKTPLLAESNRAIGGHAPSEYIPIILQKAKGITEAELRERIESHFINYDYLKSDDFDAYFIDRAKKLLNLIEKAMGKRVADRGAELTIKQFGSSLE